MRSFIPDRFALTRTLREDRQSTTFLATDHLLDRDNIILKIIRKDYVQADRDQLVEHFSWVVGVQHDQFAIVLDAGLTKQHHLYYVREYLPPSELLSADPLTTMKSLVSAVDFLSGNGRVHGGMKPSNVFVTNGSLKLADAKFLGLRSFDDEQSVHFFAPEILQGGAISHESDLYSVGAILYRLLTGRHLFEDPDLSRLRSKYMSASPPPATYLWPVPQGISELVPELLSKEPGKRITAFAGLKRTLALEGAVASRAAFVGRENQFRQAVEMVQNPTKNLRVLLIEGEIGIGKSRFVAEMQLHCAFHGQAFVVWHCSHKSKELAPVTEGLNKLLNCLNSLRARSKIDLGSLTPAIPDYLTVPGDLPAKEKN